LTDRQRREVEAPPLFRVFDGGSLKRKIAQRDVTPFSSIRTCCPALNR
jgi:hypothetical protein